MRKAKKGQNKSKDKSIREEQSATPKQEYYPMPYTIRGRLLKAPMGIDISLDEAAGYVEQDMEHNKASAMASQVSGCVRCLTFFSSSKYKSHTVDDRPANAWPNDTVFCPCCDHPAVLNDVDGWPMSVPFFLAMRERIYPELDHYSDFDIVVYKDSIDEANDWLERNGLSPAQ